MPRRLTKTPNPEMKRNSLTKQDDTENSEEQLPSIEQISRLAQRLKKDRSDTRALKQLRWALRKHPSAWRRAGDLARLAASELAKQVAGGTVFARRRSLPAWNG